MVLVHKNEFYSLWQQQDNRDQHHYPNSFSLSQSLWEDTTPGEQKRVVLRAEGPHCPAPAAVPTEARPGWEGSPASVYALAGGQLQDGNLLVPGRWKSSTHGRTLPQAGLEGNPPETDERKNPKSRVSLTLIFHCKHWYVHTSFYHLNLFSISGSVIEWQMNTLFIEKMPKPSIDYNSHPVLVYFWCLRGRNSLLNTDVKLTWLFMSI